MPNSQITYNVGLNLSTPLSIADYVLKVGDREFKVRFIDPSIDEYICDLVIIDIETTNLHLIPNHVKACEGNILILNTISNPLLELEYENTFDKATFHKYKTLKNITEKAISKFINTEIIKDQLKNNKIGNLYLLGSKFTRLGLLSEFLKLSWLIIPFLIVLLYLVVKFVMQSYGSNISFLCTFADYAPDCRTNVLEELKLIALLYSVFNLKSYHDYILLVLDNINNDVFQFNIWTKLFHKFCQFITPIFLFASSVIILKEIFVFKHSFKIASEYGFINIADLFDRFLPYLNERLLIYYFLVLDVFLYLMTKNFMYIKNRIPFAFASNKQNILIKDAKRSFVISACWDFSVLVVGAFIFKFLIKDPQSIVVIQLLVLQIVFIYINVSDIIKNYRYN